MKSKLLYIFILLMSNVGFSLDQKPTKRLLYEKYFKQLFDYEPAVIRENQIKYLQNETKQFRGDSLIYSKINKKLTFRADGRPIQKVEWGNYYSDSVVTDFKYDQKGNLVEYIKWTPNRYIKSARYNGKQIIENIFYEYQNGFLQKVMSYSNRNSYDSNLQLNFCDSLHLTNDATKLYIYHGNAKRKKILFNKQPEFVYPYFKSPIDEYVYIKNSAGKQIDLESDWVEKCVYKDSILIEIQKLTQQSCLNQDIVNGVRGENSLIIGSRNIFTKQSEPFRDESEKVKIDTLNREISIKNFSFISEPTSLENRITTTTSTQFYNYNLQLTKSVSFIESSRGQWEYSNQKVENHYDYFPFGLQKEMRTYHYRVETDDFEEALLNKYDNTPFLIEKQITAIKQWGE